LKSQSITAALAEMDEGAALIALLIGSSAEAEVGANRLNKTKIDITFRIQTSNDARKAFDLFEELLINHEQIEKNLFGISERQHLTLTYT
jgi:hypothetical protein